MWHEDRGGGERRTGTRHDGLVFRHCEPGPVDRFTPPLHCVDEMLQEACLIWRLGIAARRTAGTFDFASILEHFSYNSQQLRFHVPTRSHPMGERHTEQFEQ